MSVRDKAKELYEMINRGEAMDAFEKFYADDVVMVEATGDVRKGKDNNREFEIQFFSNVQEVHGGGVNSITADEDNGTTMVEAWMDLTFKDGNRVKMEEVARQQWKDGKIVNERFYYNPGPVDS